MQYHLPMRRAVCVSILLLASSCALPSAVELLQDENPPAELGRPAWVRTTAGAGAWLGGVVGTLVSVVLLPMNYPLSLAADEPLGMSTREFRYFPTYLGAATGHFLLGVPLDFLDFTFHRAWVGTPPPAGQDYGFTPMAPPMGPEAEPPTSSEGEEIKEPEDDKTDPDQEVRETGPDKD